MRKSIAALLAACFLSGAALAETPAAAPARAPVMADPALWVVKDEDTTIYLFGTVHVLKPDIQWFDGGVKEAYDASSEIIFEILEPTPDAAQKVIMAKAVDPDGPPLSQKLTPEQRTAFEAAMTKLGLPAAAFEGFEPWFAATALSLVSVQKAGFSGESGVEKQLGTQAKKDGKTLGELETLEEQINLFDSLPEPQQLAFLTATVDEIGNAGVLLDAMVASWAKGDPDGLAAQINRSSSITPELSKLLLADRNARWAGWIEQRMAKPGTIFIAVGAGHLAGKDSVQDYLKTRRLKAQRIPS